VIRACLEIGVDLRESEVVDLTAVDGQLAHPGAWVPGYQPSLHGLFQDDGEIRPRVVDGLRRQLAGVDQAGHRREPLADPLLVDRRELVLAEKGRSRLRPWVVKSSYEPAVMNGFLSRRTRCQKVSNDSRETRSSPRRISSSRRRRPLAAALCEVKPRREDSVPSD
jgi:hypothetical protein